MKQTSLFDAPIQPQPSEVEEGKRLARAGAQLAADHADREDPGWQDRAYSMLLAFTASAVGNFEAVDIRRYADERGLSEPPDRRAWGAVLMRAARAKVIVRAGFVLSKDRVQHSAPSTSWRKP